MRATIATALADRYHVKRELGSGGMATVWLAHDLRHERDVAIKVLHPDLGAALGSERFLTEIRTTARLQHPHILPLLDSGEADGLLYYVMPVVAGESLRVRLERERQLPIADAVRIAREVASALDYAHRQGVIHRDIKPENILLHDGAALVADFGIALAVEQAGGARMTQTGLSLGTPQYMSPEQAMGERAIDARSDVYALGATTYEMLTGDPPFTGSSVQAIVAKVMAERPTPPHLVRDTVPVHVEQAVLTALAKLPADRFATAAQFGEALVTPGHERTIVGTTAASVAPPRARRTGLVALAAALVVASAAAVWGWMRPVPERLAVAFREPFPDSPADPPCCGLHAAISADGNTLYFIVQVGDTYRVVARALGALAATPIAGTDGASSIALSPDGRRLAFQVALARGLNPRGEWEIRTVPIEGGVATTLARVRHDRLFGLTWLDDGSVVYAIPSGVMRIPPGGGRPAPISEGKWVWYLDRIPGANAVLANIADTVVALPLDGSAARRIVQGDGGRVAGDRLFVVSERGVVSYPFDRRALRVTGPAEPLAEEPLLIYTLAASPAGTVSWNARSLQPLLVMRDGDRTDTLLAATSPTVVHYDKPRFSPDGRRVSFAESDRGDHHAYVLDLGRRSTTRLTFEGFSESIDWTRDGESLVVQRHDSMLVLMSPDRAGPERVLTANAGGAIVGLTVGGSHVAYAAVGRLGTSRIRIFRLDRPEAVRDYLASTSNETDPALSPDGTLLAWVSPESGREEVYVGTAPVRSAQAAVSTEGGVYPVWSRDGRTLYYRSDAGELAAVPVSVSGGRITLGARRVVGRLGLTTFDVDAAGRRIETAVRGGEAQLVVMTRPRAGGGTRD